ncbi:hypothetical protein SAMN04489712_105189 [Thermomonospora echinospora]|uniref:Uncharacterized protein n=1 Tax=Thermomonospora echinospora TaxID=1992 RepID=A0A1H6A5K7_9ACTN|nr:hypothetical protein [Thermomonospora echinospora]SEG43307.1 hypothetical protein SAMN04489712_105189 [Thermomonospora echinospora]
MARTVSIVAALVGSGPGEAVADMAREAIGKTVCVKCAGSARGDARPVALVPPPAGVSSRARAGRLRGEPTRPLTE